MFARKKKIFAFCGIGNPESFFDNINDLGFKVVKKKIFPDHYKFSHAEILELRRIAKLEELILLTSEKDMQRIKKEDRKYINFTISEIQFYEEKKLLDFILRKLLYRK